MDREGSRQFGDLLSHYRRAARLTQEALAERAGLSARGIQDLERGVRWPQRDTCRRLIAALGLAGADRDRFVKAAVDRPPRVGDATLLRDRAVSRLPTPLTSLIGREGEVAEVRRLLRSTRLMTLTGPGGVGKTRLAIEVAASMRQDFEHGVVFVELAPVTEAEAVLPVIVQALGIRETGGQSPIDILEDYLCDRRLLLVLDNFEHVLPAESDVAGADVKDEELVLRVVEVLERCQSLRVLVTSREALRIQGEQEYLVPTLRLPRPEQAPPVEQLERYEAVRLFVERARAVRPDLLVDETTGPAIVEICRRLDGLPLAIELAAARAKLLPPTAMLARLSSRLPLLTGGGRDTPARHQTLRATIAWSYNLLTPEEQAVFRRLAVFAGGWTLEAAEAVCGDVDGAELSVLDGIAALLDKSLLRQEQAEDGSTRFAMLETIREFALEQLDAARNTNRLRQRHAEYYLLWAEQAEPQLQGSEQAVWLRRVGAEQDNLRVGMQWAHHYGYVEIAMRYGAAMWRFWHVRGHLSEGRAYLAGLLVAAPPGERDDATILRARVLHGSGILAYAQDELDRASELHRESLRLHTELGDDVGAAASLNNLGLVAIEQGRYEDAEALLIQGLALRVKLDHKEGIASTTNNIGLLYVRLGNRAKAEHYLAQSLALNRALGDHRSAAHSLANLGKLAVDAGDDERAEALLQESLTLRRELNDSEGIASSLSKLGLLARRTKKVRLAVSLLQQSLNLYRQIGSRLGMASSLEMLAGVIGDLGNPILATRLLGAACAIRDAIGTPLPPKDRSTIERDIAAAKQALDHVQFSAAWTAGYDTALELTLDALAPILDPEATSSSDVDEEIAADVLLSG